MYNKEIRNANYRLLFHVLSFDVLNAIKNTSKGRFLNYYLVFTLMMENKFPLGFQFVNVFWFIIFSKLTSYWWSIYLIATLKGAWSARRGGIGSLARDVAEEIVHKIVVVVVVVVKWLSGYFLDYGLPDKFHNFLAEFFISKFIWR